MRPSNIQLTIVYLIWQSDPYIVKLSVDNICSNNIIYHDCIYYLNIYCMITINFARAIWAMSIKNSSSLNVVYSLKFSVIPPFLYVFIFYNCFLDVSMHVIDLLPWSLSGCLRITQTILSLILCSLKVKQTVNMDIFMFR